MPDPVNTGVVAEDISMEELEREEAQQAPPPEPSAEPKNIDLEDVFEEGLEKPPAKAKAEPEATEEDDTEPPVAKTKPKPPEPFEAITGAKPLVDKTPKARDYSNCTPEQTEVLKAMRNSEYNLAKPLIDKLNGELKSVTTLKTELEQLKAQAGGQLPQNWYEHQDAYKLSPQWSQLEGQFSQLQNEMNYAQQALVAIEGGTEFRPFKGYDQQGQMVFGEPRAGTIEDKLTLQRALANGSVQEQQLRQNAANLQTGFATQYQQANQQIDQWEQKATSKIPPELLPKDEDVKNYIKAAFHPSVQGHRLALHAGRLYSMLLNQSALLRKYQEGAATTIRQQIATGKSAKVSPNGATAASRKSNGVINLADLDKEMNGEA